MARKSTALRLSQSHELYTAYTAAGLADTKGGCFMRDMISRLERGKGLSQGMRKWLDSLIDEGVPTPKGDPVVIARLDAVVEAWKDNRDREWEAGVIADFRHKFVMGWNLSEKQTALMERLLKRADDDASGANLFTPTDAQRADLEALVKLYNGYTGQWQAERPAVNKAFRRVKGFLAGEGTIEEYHYNKLYKAMGSRLRKLHSPRFAAGDIGWVTLLDGKLRGAYNGERTREICTAITDAYVDERGGVVNDWLLTSGVVVSVDQDQIGKRRG